jgi:hypothetical protein
VRGAIEEKQETRVDRSLDVPEGWALTAGASSTRIRLDHNGQAQPAVKQQRESAVAATTKRGRMARVQVDDATWADFRALAGYRPVSVVLGELVTREVQRYRSRRLREGELDDREVVEALELAREQQADLHAIVDRLERAAEAHRRFHETEEE